MNDLTVQTVEPKTPQGQNNLLGAGRVLVSSPETLWMGTASDIA